MKNLPLLLILVALGVFTLLMTDTVGCGARDRTSSALPATTAPTPEPAALAPLAAPKQVAELSLATDATEPARRQTATLHEDELARGHWIDGRVLFPEGTPADEKLFVVAHGKRFEDGELHRVPVAADGTFRVCFAESTRKGRLALEARYLFLEESPRFEVEGAPVILLEPRLGGRIAGRLVPPDGARVSAEKLAGSVRLWNREGDRRGEQRADPDADLAFAFDAVPVGSTWTVRLDARGFEFQDLDSLTVAGGRTTEVVLPLARGRTVAGFVVDEGGQPLEGVSIDLVERSTDRRPSHPTASTGADGSFRVLGVRTAPTTLHARLADHRDVWRDLVELAAGTDVLDLRIVLTRGLEVSGRVEWPDGTPAGGVSLSVDVTEGDGWETWGLRTAADGSFLVEGLGEQSVRIAASGLLAEEVEVTSPVTGATRTRTERRTLRAALEDVRPGATGLVLVFGSGTDVSGVVHDERGAPVPAFRVQATLVVQRDSDWNDGASGFGASFEADDGRFTLAAVPPGRWQFQVAARGFGTSEAVERRLPDEIEPLAFTLGRVATVSGLVRTPAGSPAANATVVVRSEDRLRGHMKDEPVAAELDGSFRLEKLEPGAVTLRARADGFAESDPLVLVLQPGEELHGLELRLRPGAMLTGNVLGLDRRPDARREVRLWDTLSGATRTVLTGEDGTFRLEGLAPGPVQVSVEPTAGEIVALGGEAADSSARALFTRSASVTLAEGGVEHVVLAFGDFDVVRVTGTVRIGGEPFADARIHAASPEGGQRNPQARTGPDGTYAITLPSAGTYWFLIGDREWSVRYQLRVEVPPVDGFVHDVELAVGAIAGTVFGPDGRPRPGVAVRAAGRLDPDGRGGDGSNVWGEVRTDADGRYALGRLAVATYEVRAGQALDLRELPDSTVPVTASARVDGVVVTSGAVVDGIDFHLESGGTVEGTVRDQDGRPLAGVAVLAQDEDGVRLGDWPPPTDAAGRFRLVGLPAGEVTLSAQSQVGASVPADAVVRAGETTTVELEVRSAGWLQVHLLAPNGERHKGEVRVLESHAASVHFLPERHWRVGPLPVGDYTVQATVNGVEQQRQVTVIAGEPQVVEFRF